MSFTHQDTVSAITYSLIREECAEGDSTAELSKNAVVRFVLEQYDRMPVLLRLPIKLLTLVFDARAILTSGRPFHRLGSERIHAQIAIIGSGPGGAITAHELVKRGRDVLLI